MYFSCVKTVRLFYFNLYLKVMTSNLHTRTLTLLGNETEGTVLSNWLIFPGIYSGCGFMHNTLSQIQNGQLRVMRFSLHLHCQGLQKQ